jgi:pimeloyl-ACP methyl ester carboxylesterase
MKRRTLLHAAASAPLGTIAMTSAIGTAVAQPRAMKTYVLVHGAWHGGWCWTRVADRLRAAGHRVFTPTMTGLGERAHLLSKEITLDTFTTDVSNVIEFEELRDIILVGHSFGGMPISGAAERLPDRIRHLVYLDSLILPGGKAPFDMLPPDIVAARRKAAEESSGGLSIPNPPPSAFGVSTAEDVEWVKRRLTPHPLTTFASPLNIKGPTGNNLARTYIACTNPIYGPLEASRNAVKGQPGWSWVEIATGHDAMVTAPEELTRLLLEIA